MTRRQRFQCVHVGVMVLVILACSRTAMASSALSIQWNPPSTGSGRGAINLTLTSSAGTYTKTIRYGEFSTAYSLAAAVGGVLSQDPSCPVWAKGNSDGTVSMVARSGTVSSISASMSADSGSVPSGMAVTADSGGIGASTATPSISGLSVTTAQIGQSVTISGSNFGTSTTSQVLLGGVPMTVTAFSSTQITVQVGNGSTTGNVVVVANSIASNQVLLMINQTPVCTTTPSVPTFPN